MSINSIIVRKNHSIGPDVTELQTKQKLNFSLFSEIGDISFPFVQFPVKKKTKKSLVFLKVWQTIFSWLIYVKKINIKI